MTSPREVKRRARQRSGEGGSQRDARAARAYQDGIRAATAITMPVLRKRFWWDGFRAGLLAGGISCMLAAWAHGAWGTALAELLRGILAGAGGWTVW